jgi:hypothetical protein
MRRAPEEHTGGRPETGGARRQLAPGPVASGRPDRELAQQLARDRGVDLHALIELVERGCPPSLAARILAPLEHERRGC